MLCHPAPCSLCLTDLLYDFCISPLAKSFLRSMNHRAILSLVSTPLGASGSAALGVGYSATVVFIKRTMSRKGERAGKYRHAQTPVMDVCLQTCLFLQLWLQERCVNNKLQLSPRGAATGVRRACVGDPGDGEHKALSGCQRWCSMQRQALQTQPKPLKVELKGTVSATTCEVWPG